MRNRVQCLECGDVIESRHRHDFVWCKCGAVAVDGGQSYARRIGNPSSYTELPFEDEQVTEGADTGAVELAFQDPDAAKAHTGMEEFKQP